MILEILDRLESLYHNEENPPNLKHSEPLDGLVLTVLSQNTNDLNRDRAFANLKANFPTWQEVADTNSRTLEDSIRIAGLARTKSARILSILQTVHHDFGEYSLKALEGREDIREYLRKFPGVGAKTAACVMLFDFGLKAFPVDTHITRIAKRTGIADEKNSAEEISKIFENVVPAERCLGGHVNLIQHGRTYCRSRNPLCESCILNRRDNRETYCRFVLDLR